MKKITEPVIISLFLGILMTAFSYACTEKQEKSEPANWAERLGFPKGKKVIILHADDAGMCDEANAAITQMLNNDNIQSTAVMVPCPSADAMIAWALENPGEDVGLHLTLTSEWNTHRWGPVSDPDLVPGLIDPEGMMWRDVPDVLQHSSAEEIETEIRAQIERSLSLGYHPDHIDSHMGTLFSHTNYLKAFFKVAEEYGIPANIPDLSDTAMVDMLKMAGYPIDEAYIELSGKYSLPKLDYITWAPEGKDYGDKIEKFKALVRSFSPGLIEIVFHPSVESENLKGITNSWQQRVWEYEMFGDQELIDFFREEGIIFTNWKEVMERFNADKE
ncbi:MAG: polysaccharide deacetylase family protein [Bacteroidota bacterium]